MNTDSIETNLTGKSKLLSLFLAASLILLPAAVAQAVTVCKDGSCDKTSIKAALNDTDFNGQDVVVGPGTYNESNLTVGGTSQGGPRTLISENPDNPESTIIDATGTDQWVIGCLYGGTIRGFTIKGGKGGILIYGTNIVLQDLIIEDNVNDVDGGGVGTTGGSVQLEIIDCTIRNNKAESGGGVAFPSGDLTIRGSRIEGNEAFGNSIGYAYGGGIAVGSFGSLVIEDTVITGNFLTGFRRNTGAGISTRRTTWLNNVDVLNNIANEAESTSNNGGGIYKSKPTGSGAYLYITGGTIDGNQADRGGGVYLDTTSRLVSSGAITNNVARAGIAGSSGGGVYCSWPNSIESLAGNVSGNSPDQLAGCGSNVDPPLGTTRTAADNEQSGDSNDPVNTFTGELYNQYDPDISLGGAMPLYFARYYSSGFKQVGIFANMGDNWRHNYDWKLTIIGTTIHVVDHHGRTIQFVQNGPAWDLDGKTDIVYQLSENAGVYTLLDPRNQRSYAFNSAGLLTSISDGRGNVHTLSYASGPLTQVSDGLGRTLTFTYSGGKLSTVTDGTRTVGFTTTGNDLTQVTDALGNITTYAYGTGGLIASSTLPAGNTPYSQTWNASGQVATQTDADGNAFSFDYSGLDTTITGPLGNTRVHTHTATGEFSNREDQAGLSFSMGSDSTGRRNSLTDRLGDTTTIDYDATSGNISAVTNTDGTTSDFSYTERAFGDLTLYDLTTITHADGTTESLGYDAMGNVTSHTDQIGNTATATYNANGQVLTATNVAGGTRTNTHNTDGTLASRTDPAGNTTTFGYDSLKRLNLITFADGNTQSVTYNDLDQVVTTTDGNGNIMTYTYDANGNLTSTTDALGNTTAYTHDGNERPLTATDPLGNTASRSYHALGEVATITDENSNTTTFGYDILGRHIATTDPLGQVWGQTYDAEAILASSTDPLGNTTSFVSDTMGRITEIASPLGNVSSVSYDAMGRLASTNDPLGNTTTLARDPRGLLTGMMLPGGTISASLARDPLGNISAITDPNGNLWQRDYDTSGRLTSSSDPLGYTTTFTHDSRNRLAAITYPPELGTADLDFDPAGNLTGAAFTDGPTLEYTYDANDRIIAANDITWIYDANDRIIETNGIVIVRDPAGRITSMVLAPGKNVTYAYDANNRLVQVTDWAGGTTSFSYDAAGQLTAIVRPNGVNTTNTWDADSRLIGIAEGTVSTITLTRDAKGQIIAADRDVPLPPSPTALTSVAYSYDAASQVSGFTYDGLGRLTDDGDRTYTWDTASRLTSITEAGTTTTFTYDALGQRLSRTLAGTTKGYVWNYAFGLPSVSIETESGVDRRYFIHTPAGALLYSIDAATDARQFYHFDETGNTLFVTNDSGTVIGSYAYTPYGQLIASTGQLENPFTWQGAFGVMDDGNSLYYVRARYYDANTGRFISRDAKRSIYPREVNPYQYALGNPLRFSDPSGNSSVAELKAKLDDAKERLRAAQITLGQVEELGHLYEAFELALENQANTGGGNQDTLGIVRSKSGIKKLRARVKEIPEFARILFLQIRHRHTTFEDLEEDLAQMQSKVNDLEAAYNKALYLQTLALLPYSNYQSVRELELDGMLSRALRQKREAYMLHLRAEFDRAHDKASKARDALRTGGTRTRAEQAALLQAFRAAITERDRVGEELERAGGVAPVVSDVISGW